MEWVNLIVLLCFIGIFNNVGTVTMSPENVTQYVTTMSTLNEFTSATTRTDTNTNNVTSTSHIISTIPSSTTTTDNSDNTSPAQTKNVTDSNKDTPKDLGENKTNSITTFPTPIFSNTNNSVVTPDLNNTNSSTTAVSSTSNHLSSSTPASNFSSSLLPTSNSTPIIVPTPSITNTSSSSLVPIASTSKASTVKHSATTILSTSSIISSTTSTIILSTTTKMGNEGTVSTTIENQKGTTETTSDGSGVHISGKKTCEDSAFGKLGLVVFIALSIVCIILMVALIFLILKHTRRKKQGVKVIQEEEKTVPKLKMLEIKDTQVKTYSKTGGADDGLQTFSLDYEQYVQQKKEEHKRKVANTNSASTFNSDGQAVSSFLIGKRPLVMQATTNSGNSSPRSPNSPLIASSDKAGQVEDEPVVFNFTKTPGESLAARRASKPEQDDRRRSSTPSAKNAKGLELSPDNFTIDL